MTLLRKPIWAGYARHFDRTGGYKTLLALEELRQTFLKMSDAELVNYDETDFRSVYQRLMYGLRHGQHHVGKLTAYLNLEGVQLNHWKG
jgi:hypothetical protein